MERVWRQLLASGSNGETGVSSCAQRVRDCGAQCGSTACSLERPPGLNVIAKPLRDTLLHARRSARSTSTTNRRAARPVVLSERYALRCVVWRSIVLASTRSSSRQPKRPPMRLRLRHTPKTLHRFVLHSSALFFPLGPAQASRRSFVGTTRSASASRLLSAAPPADTASAASGSILRTLEPKLTSFAARWSL